ncbi:MAG: hypothetical protein Q4B30_00845 [Coriobacteriaceae bacterium]|nr:hypothetical protein [Coriobacteriaceae bacterium]
MSDKKSDNNKVKMKTRDHKPSRIVEAVKSFFKRGSIFKGVSYFVQVGTFTAFAYVTASLFSTFVLMDIVKTFGAYAVDVTGAPSFGDLLLGDLFGFFMLPSAFMALVLFAAYIAVCAFVWRVLAKWMGRLRELRSEQLNKRDDAR